MLLVCAPSTVQLMRLCGLWTLLVESKVKCCDTTIVCYYGSVTITNEACVVQLLREPLWKMCTNLIFTYMIDRSEWDGNNGEINLPLIDIWTKKNPNKTIIHSSAHLSPPKDAKCVEFNSCQIVDWYLWYQHQCLSPLSLSLFQSWQSDFSFYTSFFIPLNVSCQKKKRKKKTCCSEGRPHVSKLQSLNTKCLLIPQYLVIMMDMACVIVWSVYLNSFKTIITNQ